MLVTIDKQEGHGPYFFVVEWRDARTKITSLVVFSHWDDAWKYHEAVISNGNEIVQGPILASDFCRKEDPAPGT